MTRKAIIRCALSVVLTAYLIFALGMSHDMVALDRVTGVEINVLDTGSHHGKNFVTVDGISSEIGDLPTDTTLLSKVDIRGIERRLDEVVNIETAQVTRSQTGRIHIDVMPMIPVARVFSSDGTSYYINRAGKRLTADARYHVDVPVVTGDIDRNGKIATVDLLPLMHYVASDSLLNSLTTSLKVTSAGDVILIPAIRGHVVNLGDPRDNNTSDKFARLLTMYRKVLPVKGWLYYDTISVKYSGQVVATRAKKRDMPQIAAKELIDPEEETLDNMLTTAAGSADNTPAVVKKKQ